MPVPPFPSLFATDITEERLAQKMHDRDGAYAVMSGEGRPIFDAIQGKHTNGNQTGDATYLAGISGDTITRDRVGGEGGPEERVIRNPCLNVCAMVQPDKYLEAAGNSTLRASGALARIWPVWLRSMVGTRLESEDDQGLDTSVEAGTVKTAAAELKFKLGSLGIDILGHDGLVQGPGAPIGGMVNHQYNTGLTGLISGGSLDIQRLVIARRGLGLR